MTVETTEKSEFEQMLDDYRAMKPGSQAELRRVTEPQALLLQPAFYRLTGGRTGEAVRRVAFIIPWIEALSEQALTARAEKENVGRRKVMPPGRAFALADMLEGGGKVDGDKLSSVGVRLTQIKRMDAPQDIVQLRRLIQHLGKSKRLAFDWPLLAWTLVSWDKEKNGRSGKQNMLEDYFRYKYASEKQAKKGK